MYAEIPSSEARKFKLLIKEGQVYMFRKFIVSGCKSAYKPFKNRQMIRFTPWTTVLEQNKLDDKFPKYLYDLVDFEEFPSSVGQVECFVDTIGMVVGVSKIAHIHLPLNHSSAAKRVIS